MRPATNPRGCESEYRPNVGLMVMNRDRRCLWGRRSDNHFWQFPQGGIESGESPTAAMARELREETGLNAADTRVVARTRDWLFYDFPSRRSVGARMRDFRGQKQIWFLLAYDGPSAQIDLPTDGEFDAWEWKTPQQAADEIVVFKRAVYRAALVEFEPHLQIAQAA